MTDTPPIIPPEDEAAGPIPAAPNSPPKTKLEQQTEEELLQKVIEYKNLALRATADYQNLQRESTEKLADIRKYATEGLLLELCPLVDYFNTAFASIPSTEQQSSWLQGIKHIQTYLLKVLQDNNVELMQPVGQPFDPHRHEAVSEEASDTQAPNTVLRVLQAGFTLNGKVIRHAKVVVTKAPNENENKTVKTPGPDVSTPSNT